MFVFFFIWSLTWSDRMHCVLEREKASLLLCLWAHLLLRRWVTDPESSVSKPWRSLCTAWLTALGRCERGKPADTSVWTVFRFTFSSARLLLSPKLGVMSPCCCRQVLLGVELGMLLAVLVAGAAGQTHDRGDAGSSCYGGFDLYFVLDKWVYLITEERSH